MEGTGALVPPGGWMLDFPHGGIDPMTQTLPTAWRFVPLAAVMLFLGTGCPWDPEVTKPIPQSKYLAQSSPANVLANLKTAYEERNYDEYAKLFHQEYVFLFNPDDVQGDNPTPDSWTRVEELQSAQGLFEDETVERIQLTFNQGDPEAWSDIPPGGLKVRMDGVFLTVTTRNEQGEPLYLVVQGATHWFYFFEDEARPASDGKPVSEIRLWEDSPIGGKLAASGD